MTPEEILAAWRPRLEQLQSKKRLEHTVGVWQVAVELANRFGADPEKAALAAVLHDVTKGFSAEEHLALCRQYGREMDRDTLNSPPLYHAFTAPLYAEKVLGVTDPEVLEAIRWHTTGKVGMSTLEMVVFLADCIEPAREYPGVDRLRELAGTDLALAVRRALEGVMGHVLQSGDYLHPDTLRARNSLL